MFEDVVSLVLNNYVEEVDVKKAMKGAMNGLADNLDADSALPSQPTSLPRTKRNSPPGPADVGLELSRQYYLRVVSVRDGSPAAKAGLRPGDFIRADRQAIDQGHFGLRRRPPAARPAGQQGLAARHPRQRRRSA